MDNINAADVKKLKGIYTKIVRGAVNPEFYINEGGSNLRVIKKTLEDLKSRYGSVSPERIVDFCICAAYTFRNRPRYQLKQAFGQSMMERFSAHTQGHKYYEDQWLQENNLSRKELIDSITPARKEHPLAKYIYIASEDYTKQRMLNDEVGYVLCQQSTLGWSPCSQVCQRCNFTERCKIETEKNYPELYRIRLEYGTHPK